jgi:hypothetical protein
VRGCLGRLLHGDKALQVGVLVDLLLDRSKFDQLLRKLIGIERIERILVCSCVVRSCKNVLKLPASCCEAFAPAA